MPQPPRFVPPDLPPDPQRSTLKGVKSWAGDDGRKTKTERRTNSKGRSGSKERTDVNDEDTAQERMDETVDSRRSRVPSKERRSSSKESINRNRSNESVGSETKFVDERRSRSKESVGSASKVGEYQSASKERRSRSKDSVGSEKLSDALANDTQRKGSKRSVSRGPTETSVIEFTDANDADKQRKGSKNSTIGSTGGARRRGSSRDTTSSVEQEARRPSKESRATVSTRQSSKESVGTANRRDSSETLASMTWSSSSSKVNPDRAHPHSKLHAQVVKTQNGKQPAASIETWFDCALAKSPEQSTEIVRERALPPEYIGGATLISAADSGIQIWPLRVDVGAVGEDGKHGWTVYHYAHKESFNTFMETFSKLHGANPQDLSDKVGRVLLPHFHRDCLERSLTQHEQEHGGGDPDLLTVEPSRFASKDEALIALFGAVPFGQNSQGIKFDTFADYCIAIRVPETVCLLLHKTKRDEQSEQVPQRVRILMSEVEALRRRARVKRESEQKLAQKAAEDANANKYDPAKRPKGIWGFFGCGGPPPKEWDEVEPEPPPANSDNWLAGSLHDRVNRERRFISRKQKRLEETWTKAHYWKESGWRSTERKQQVEQDKKMKAAEKSGLLKELALSTESGSADASKKTMPQQRRTSVTTVEDDPKVRKSSKETTDASASRRSLSQEADAASVEDKHELYNTRKSLLELEKTEGKAAMNRMKMRAVVRIVQTMGPPKEETEAAPRRSSIPSASMGLPESARGLPTRAS